MTAIAIIASRQQIAVNPSRRDTTAVIAIAKQRRPNAPLLNFGRLVR